MPYKNIEDQRASQRRHYDNNIEKFRTEGYRAASRERMAAARKKDPEPNNAAGRKWRAGRSSDQRKDSHLKRTYGITIEQWDQMFLEQGSRCAICRCEDASRWHVDHCHTTQRVRGILCSHCNLMIGHAKDNIQTLLTAAEYLNAQNIIRR
jgi:hypothetical protein